MKTKLCIAAALAHDPKLLIMDEATSGLDPMARDEILDLLYTFMQDESHAIFFSSHIVSDLEKICDYIAFLHKGKLVFCEEKDRLNERYALVKCSAEQFSALPLQSIHGYRKNAFGIEALVERKAIAGNLITERASIEEIMVFMGRENAQ